MSRNHKYFSWNELGITKSEFKSFIKSNGYSYRYMNNSSYQIRIFKNDLGVVDLYAKSMKVAIFKLNEWRMLVVPIWDTQLADIVNAEYERLINLQ